MIRNTLRCWRNATIAYAVPKEGSELWFQLFVLPQNGKNPDAAYQLVNFMLTPEVAAEGTKTCFTPTRCMGLGR